jgi:hypothetical protein
MQTLFVYYKIAAAEHAAVLRRVRLFEKQVEQAWPSLQIELMQRPETSADGQETWMEVYRHPQGVTQAMTESIAQLAAQAGLPSQRASEFFIPLEQQCAKIL